MNTKKPLTVSCPRCQKKFDYYTSEFRPFCCERCRLIDLGQWMNESYTVPAQKLTPEEQEQLERIFDEKGQGEESNNEDD